MKKGKKWIKSILSSLLSAAILVSLVSIPKSDISAKGTVDDFVERCYTVTLDRGSDPAGFEDWKNQLLNGKSVGTNIAYGFLFSKEYKNKNKSNEAYVKDLYMLFMGREPDEGGFNDWVGKLNQGKSREEVFAGFANSQEFYNICEEYGITAGYYMPGYDRNQVNNVNLFVERLYQITLGRRGDRDGQRDWVSKLLKKQITGVECARCFIQSKEYKNKRLNDEKYVENMYQALMGRKYDDGGKEYWLGKIKGGMTRDQVFAGFANSKEFGNICAEYKINKGTYVPVTKPNGTFIMYFSGIDEYNNDVTANHNSDSNIIVAVNTKTRHIQTIHIPRDYYITFPNSKGQKDKLTHAGLYGVDTSIGALNTLFNIKIDYYFKTNFTGLENIVDEMGGIDVYSEYTFDATYGREGHYTTGYNHLDGKHALTFLRERASFNDKDYRKAGDFQRGRHHLLFMEAMVKKVCSKDVLNNFGNINNNIKDAYVTDFSELYLGKMVADQIKDPTAWKVDRFVLGADDIREETTFTYPDNKETVVIPNGADVEKAKELISAVLNETK